MVVSSLDFPFIAVKIRIILSTVESPFSWRVTAAQYLQRSPERPLNTSGAEQDAGFTQEELKIYDTGDTPEVNDSRLCLHTSVQHHV